MNNKPSHFAIYIDDIDRAKKFYANLFEWEFNTYGPPDFLQIKSGQGDQSELIGALQARKYSPIESKVIGFECTINVSDIDFCEKVIVDNGGQIVLPKTEIPTVGYILKFLDPEGNLVAIMQYH